MIICTLGTIASLEGMLKVLEIFLVSCVIQFNNLIELENLLEHNKKAMKELSNENEQLKNYLEKGIVLN